MIAHDKEQIEKLKKLKEEYKVILRLSKEERIKRFLESFKEESRRKNCDPALNL